MNSVTKVIKLFENESEIKTKETCATSHVFLKVDKPIYLYGFGIYGRTPDKLDGNNDENFKIYLENSSRDCELTEEEVVVEHDGTTKTYDLFYETPMLLDVNTSYGFGVLGNEEILFERFNGVDYKKEITCDDVQFTILKCWFAKLINSVYFKRAD